MQPRSNGATVEIQYTKHLISIEFQYALFGLLACIYHHPTGWNLAATLLNIHQTEANWAIN